MHLKEKYTWMKHIDFILIDLFCLIASFFVAYYLKFESWNFYDEPEWSSLFVIVCFVNLIITLYLDPYSGAIRRRYYEQFLREIPILIYQVVIICIIFYVFKVGTLFSREMMITTYTMYFFVGHVLKYIRKRTIIGIEGRKYRKRKTLVVSDYASIDQVLQNLLVGDLIEHEVKAIYLVDDEMNSIKNIPVVRNYENLDVEEVFVATDPTMVPNKMYKYFVDNGICVNINLESIIGFEAESSFVQRVGNYRAIGIDKFQYSTRKLVYFGIKRFLDIIVGLIGMIILLPLTIIIKIAYMLTGDFKSIFYTQKRVGKDGKDIYIFKFRSMIPDAEEELEKMLKDKELKKEWEENQKFENDPRITKIGKLIRKTSIDEIPQFINVLKGDMSLIGPRPLVEGELEQHDGLKLYNKVKPGITGWWACNGRSNIEYRERLELEYYYVENCSLILDIICILKTILVVLRKEGAK